MVQMFILFICFILFNVHIVHMLQHTQVVMIFSPMLGILIDSNLTLKWTYHSTEGVPQENRMAIQ